MTKLFMFRELTRNASFHAKLTPTGSIGGGGEWFEPSEDEPKTVWKSGELKSTNGVSAKMSRAGRHEAFITISPTGGGSGTLDVWVEMGGARKEREPLSITATTTVSIFLYVK